MQLRKFRWSKVYESSEEELTGLLNARKIKAKRVVNTELEETKLEAVAHETTVWCAEGSLYLDAGINMPLQPGDAVRIPANTPYVIDAGISGCIYYLSR